LRSASFPLGRIAKFGAVGLINTGVDFALYVWLTASIGLAPVPSNMISYSVGVANSFYLNRLWTFAHGQYRDSLAYQLPRFLLGNVSGLVLSTLLIWIALVWLDPVPAKALSVVVTFVWNYWFTRSFVFRHTSPGASQTAFASPSLSDAVRESRSQEDVFFATLREAPMPGRSFAFPSFRASTGTGIVSFVVLVMLANAFAVYFVSQERYVYFWDWSSYWLMYRDFSASLLQHPQGALMSLLASIRNDDYNLLPVLPLAPFAWLFGNSRLDYILGITNVLFLPGVFLLGLFAHRLFQEHPQKLSISPFVLATASSLLLHAWWSPVLRGMPDVLGVSVIAVILLMHFTKPLTEQRLGQLVGTGVLLGLLVLVRRWYAFWVVAFFPALVVAQVLFARDKDRPILQQTLSLMGNAAIIGGTFALTLFGIAQPFVLRALRTDYSDVYSAYRSTSSLVDASGLVISYFGWTVLFCGLTGLIWLTLRRQTRVLGVFLITQSLIIFLLFARTQDFGIQHYYLLIPGVVLGIAWLQIGLWMRLKGRPWRALSLGPVFTALILSFSAAFVPQAAGISERLGILVPRASYPLVRNDIDGIDRLLDRLEGLVREQDGGIYVLASSTVLNSSIVNAACRTGSRQWRFCDRLLSTHDVDKRDGFPRQILDALYLVVASPVQYHLRPEDQRVVGVLVREVIQGRGIGASFERLPGEYALDNGVMVWVFKKVRPIPRSDLDALTEEFIGYYPDKRDIFRTTSD
jgi:putative flippase GtrA